MSNAKGSTAFKRDTNSYQLNSNIMQNSMQIGGDLNSIPSRKKVDFKKKKNNNDKGTEKIPYGRKIPEEAVAKEISRDEKSKNKEELAKQWLKDQKTLEEYFIDESYITLYSEEQIRNLKTIEILTTNLTSPNSVISPALGSTSNFDTCTTCGRIDCPGHFGVITLGEQAMIYNPEYMNIIVKLLTVICNSCGNLLVTSDIIESQGWNRLSFEARLNAMQEFCGKNLSCTYRHSSCKYGNTTNCERNPIFETTDVLKFGYIQYKNCIIKSGVNGDKKKAPLFNSPELAGVPVQIMHIRDVYKLFSNISAEDINLLGMKVHPVDLLMRSILVIPNIVRPNAYINNTPEITYLTEQYNVILNKLTFFKSIKDEDESSSESAKLKARCDIYNAVRQLYRNTDMKKIGSKEMKSIFDFLQGKTAIPRGNIQGKRNNQCGRTVAGGDPDLDFGETGIPTVWRQTLTKPRKVTDANFEFMQKLRQNGQITHVISSENGVQYPIKNAPLELKVGDEVSRCLMDGDRVNINRQPTLHKQSMMGFKVRMTPKLTITNHLSVTSPQNLDFDGDEQNLWNCQTLGSEAETELITNCNVNIMSSESNKPAMALVMNSITAGFLLSAPECIVDNDIFDGMLSYIANTRDKQTLYDRLYKYNIPEYSGRAILSALFPRDFYYNKGVKIVEGVLINGRLKSSNLGNASRSIVQDLVKMYGYKRASQFLTEAPKIFNYYLSETGFSVGIGDILNTEIIDGKLIDLNEDVINKKLIEMYLDVRSLGGKKDNPIEEKLRETRISEYLNVTENFGIKLTEDAMDENNNILIMSNKLSGTKGSMGNICQIMGIVGQQYFHQKRIQPTIDNRRRCLPNFDRNDLRPEAQGFIPNSFFKGLTPEQLFFLQVGAREGLMDTALKTAETGYMQRMLTKTYENIVSDFDRSVRNTSGVCFMVNYGCGYAIENLVNVGQPGRENLASFFDPKQLAAQLNAEAGWVEIDVYVSITGNTPNYEDLSNFDPSEFELMIQDDTTDAEYNNLLFQYTNIINPEGTFEELLFSEEEFIRMDRSNVLSKFEKTAIVTARAYQINNNSKIMLSPKDIPSNFDPVTIAIREYEQALLTDFMSIRQFPNGEIEFVYATADNL